MPNHNLIFAIKSIIPKSWSLKPRLILNKMSSEKKNWSQYVKLIQEDDSLTSIMQNTSNKVHWFQVSTLMRNEYGILNRTGKQCRERWHNHLDPTTRKREWTAEEDSIILNYQQQFGNQWAEISKFLNGRSDNNIKNHFYATIRRKIRKFNKYNHEKLTQPLSQIMNNKELIKALMTFPEKQKNSTHSEM